MEKDEENEKKNPEHVEGIKYFDRVTKTYDVYRSIISERCVQLQQ